MCLIIEEEKAYARMISGFISYSKVCSLKVKDINITLLEQSESDQTLILRHYIFVLYIYITSALKLVIFVCLFLLNVFIWHVVNLVHPKISCTIMKETDCAPKHSLQIFF